MNNADCHAAIAERDDKIAVLEQQMPDAAKNAEAADSLRNEIVEHKRQSESDRIDFELRLAGLKSFQAACAVLDDHDGNVSALKEVEPWLLADSPPGRSWERPGFPMRVPQPTRASSSSIS